MALPSPVADFPDMSGVIESSRARAAGLAQAAWADLSQLGQPTVAPAPTQQAPSQVPGQGFSSMDRWGQPVAPAEGQAPRQPNQAQFGPLNDDWSAQGFADNVPRSLIGTESGGNWMAANNEAGSGGNGHFGILQFGHGRLADGFKAGVIPEMTPDQFKRDKRAQVAMSNWHFNDIDNRIRKAGFDKMIGQSIGGAPITWNGMRAMAHLGGFGGLSQFVESQGRYNPADSFGTSLRDYAITHSKGRS